jgi:hypothetical protein
MVFRSQRTCGPVEYHSEFLVDQWRRGAIICLRE